MSRSSTPALISTLMSVSSSDPGSFARVSSVPVVSRGTRRRLAAAAIEEIVKRFYVHARGQVADERGVYGHLGWRTHAHQRTVDLRRGKHEPKGQARHAMGVEVRKFGAQQLVQDTHVVARMPRMPMPSARARGIMPKGSRW